MSRLAKLILSAAEDNRRARDDLDALCATCGTLPDVARTRLSRLWSRLKNQSATLADIEALTNPCDLDHPSDAEVKGLVDQLRAERGKPPLTEPEIQALAFSEFLESLSGAAHDAFDVSRETHEFDADELVDNFALPDAAKRGG